MRMHYLADTSFHEDLRKMFIFNVFAIGHNSKSNGCRGKAYAEKWQNM